MRTTMLVLLLASLCGLGACSPPQPPEEERRPKPKARDAAPQSAIVQAADAYKDRARNAAAQQADAADARRAEIDATTK